MKSLLIRRVLVPFIFLFGGCGGEKGDPPKIAVELSVASVSVSPATATILVGDTQPFTATVRDANGNFLSNRSVGWAIDNPSVATIQNATGVLTGIAPGSATLTATCEGSTDSATISVVANSPDPFVMEERNAGDFLIIDQAYPGPDTRWTVLFPEVLNKFYETYADRNYDFIVLCPTKPMATHWSTGLNRQIEGIGGGYGTFPLAPNLSALVVFDLFPIWNIGLPAPNFNLLNGVIMHEIGHYWLVNIKWPQHDAIGHWQNNLDLFSGDTRFIDPLAYYHWIKKNGQEACVDGNDPNVTKKFSDLSLYVMGLLPPNQVAPIFEHEFEPKPGNDYYNIWGPRLGEDHQFTETKTITIQDIININGERNPSYLQSKKDFRIAFIIVTAVGETVPSGFINDVKKYRDALPGAWSQTTSAKSRMIIN